jgi:GH25 family lysozyme M1 (1,4-beta-N-acetylmuramidase)
MLEIEPPARFARYPVIFARYNSFMGSVPAPWTKASAWQYSDSGKPAGVAAGHAVDCNVFYGTVDQLPTFGV